MTGKPVPKGAIYHFSSRRRREVNISATLHERMEAALVGIRSLMREGRLPPPVNDRRCDHCSLRDICQPEAIANQQGLSRAVGTLFDPES